MAPSTGSAWPIRIRVPSTVTCATVSSICGSSLEEQRQRGVRVGEHHRCPDDAGLLGQADQPHQRRQQRADPARGAGHVEQLDDQQRGHHQLDELPVGLEHIEAELAQFGAHALGIR